MNIRSLECERSRVARPGEELSCVRWPAGEAEKVKCVSQKSNPTILFLSVELVQVGSRSAVL